jgi:hypothetical protein
MTTAVEALQGRTIVEVDAADSPGSGPVVEIVLDDGRAVLVEILDLGDDERD